MVPRKKVLIYDSSKCTGCRSCMAGCSLQHEGECSKILSRIHIVKKEESGDNYISGCNQCEDPICAAVCHFGANKIDREKGSHSSIRMCAPAARSVLLIVHLGQPISIPEQERHSNVISVTEIQCVPDGVHQMPSPMVILTSP